MTNRHRPVNQPQKEESHMLDILHRVGIKSSSLDATYKALTTREGLSAWWTNNTQGESKVGGVLQFRFGAAGGFDMKVLELHPGKHVLWQVVGGPDEWIGTKISWAAQAGWRLHHRPLQTPRLGGAAPLAKRYQDRRQGYAELRSPETM